MKIFNFQLEAVLEEERQMAMQIYIFFIRHQLQIRNLMMS
jgi:hypothetical protein